MPKSVLRNVPKNVPSSVPRSVPRNRATPRSVPKSVPKARSTPRNAFRPGPPPARTEKQANAQKTGQHHRHAKCRHKAKNDGEQNRLWRLCEIHHIRDRIDKELRQMRAVEKSLVHDVACMRSLVLALQD